MRFDKLFVIFLMFVILISPIAAINVQDDDGSMIIVQAMTYEPFPAEPGDYLDVWLKVENRGVRDVNNFELELIPFYPFSIDGTEEGAIEISDIGTFESKLLKFRVIVDEEATDNEYALKYKYRTSSITWQEASVPITIYSINRDLSITSIMSEPENIVPGEVSEIKITFKNNADSMMRYINTQLSLVYAESATSYVELPFTPINGGSEKTIYSIPAGEEEEVVFNLMADPDATAGPYKIPIQISYFDKFGENHTRTEIIGLVVNAEPDMYVVVDSSDITKKGQSGEVYFKFINKGLTDIKFLNIEIPENENIKIIGPNNQYIGDVDSDDYETTSYRLIVQKTNGNEATIPLNLEYRDANNQLFKEEIELPLILYSAAEKGEASSNSAVVIVIVLILIVIGTIVYRKWGRKNKNKNKVKIK